PLAREKFCPRKCEVPAWIAFRSSPSLRASRFVRHQEIFRSRTLHRSKQERRDDRAQSVHKHRESISLPRAPPIRSREQYDPPAKEIRWCAKKGVVAFPSGQRSPTD